MNIIHISDVHLSKESITNFQQRIIPSLRRDLLKYSLPPKETLLIFSGDLIDQGGQSFDSISEAFVIFHKQIIDELKDCLKIEPSQIFFSPGNHDIETNQDEDFEDSGLTNKLTSEVEITNFQIKDNKKGYSRILSFKKFEREFHSNYSEKISSFESFYSTKLNNNKTGILCLNTAWRCYDSKTDFQKLLIGENQVFKHKKELDSQSFNIGVMHHHYDWLADFDKETIEPILEKNLDLLLCGHVHKASTCLKTQVYGSLLTVIAPSTWEMNIHSENKEFRIGYQVIEIKSEKVTIHHRQYNRKKDAFQSDVDNGDDEGIQEFDLPQKGDKLNFSEEHEVIRFVKDVRIPETTEHLLNYNTDSISPNEIKDIYVEPKIIEKLDINKEGEETENTILIDELLNFDENIVLFGIKESGKSLFLDKVLIDYTDCNSSLRRVPVLLDFNNIGSRSIRTLISRYLGIGIKKVDSFVKNHKIVLLIDNIDFSPEFEIRLKNIEKFLKDNESTTAVMTSIVTIEKELPIDYVSSKSFKNAKKVFLTSFKTKQIRELTSKWFKNNSSYYSEGKIEDIIKIIVSLNLPRTPLSISMFLWIIEKQENFVPVNQATMLNTFIEKLFKKHSDKEALSSEFSFQNKISLLSEIAYEMYEKDKDDYSLKYSELLTFIEGMISKKQFRFSAKDLLDHFLDRGVFNVKSNMREEHLVFRFNCFFEYFLMQRMVFDEKFKEFVLQPDNYYYFENEIDYYTGLRRYDIDILKFTTDEIYDKLSEGIKKAKELDYSFDSFFYAPKQVTISEKANHKQLASSLGEATKPTTEDLDKLKDELLDNIRESEGIPKKHKKIHPMNVIEKQLCIAMNVLKNSEEVSEDSIKSTSYRKLSEAITFFGCLYKLYLSEALEDKEGTKDFASIEQLTLSLKLLPLFIQGWFVEYIGTKKLEVVIQGHIEYLGNNRETDLEKFINVFLYSDLHGENYHKEIKKYIKSVKRKYILDMLLFKVVTYYFIRSNSEEQDKIFLDLISEIIIKAQKLPKNKKGNIIQGYIKRKTKKLGVKGKT